MSFTKLEDGRVVIPDDFKGNLDLAKVGYPDGTVFISQADYTKEGNPDTKEKKDDAGSGTEYFKNYGFDSKEAMEKFINDSKGLSQENENLKGELEKNKNNPTVIQYEVEEDLLKESLLRKESPEKYSTYMKLKYGNLSEEDVIAMGLMEENPDMFSSINEARSYVAMKYGEKKKKEIPTDAEDDEIEDINDHNSRIDFENKEAKLNRKSVANTMKNKLLGVMDSVKLPEKKDTTKELETYIMSWQPRFTETVMTDKSIVFDNGFTFNMDEELQKAYKTAAAQFVASSKFEVNDESVAKIRTYAKGVVFALKTGEILDAYANHVRKMNDSEWENHVAKKYHNSSAFSSKEKKDDEGGKKGNGVDTYLSDLDKRRR